MPDPAQPTAAPGASAPAPASDGSPQFDLAAAYQRILQQRDAELAAAQQQGAAQREKAALHSSLAGMFLGPAAAEQLWKQGSDVADQPVKDAFDRQKAREQALKQAADEGTLNMKSAQDKAAYRLMKERTDPKSNMMDYVRDNAKRNLHIDLPAGMTPEEAEGAHPVMKTFTDDYAANVAAKAQEEQTKTIASTRGIAEKKAPGEIEQAEAAAREARARATQIEQLTGGSLSHFVPTGREAVGPDQRKELEDAIRAKVGIRLGVDKILGYLHGRDAAKPLDTTTRAEIKSEINGLLVYAGRSQDFQKIAGPELHFLTSVVSNPDEITIPNLLGLSKNSIRLEKMKELADRHLSIIMGNRWMRPPNAKPAGKTGRWTIPNEQGQLEYME